MSLRSHLKDPHSPIGQFLMQRFSRTTNITKDANSQLKSTNTILPAVSSPSYPYGTIGMAIDYRIRYSFAITPSRQASLGAHQLPYQYEAGALGEEPYSLELIDAFFTRLNGMLETIRPVGRRLEPEAEQMLARYCFVLSLFEEVFRNPRTAQMGSLFVPTRKKSIDELLAIPQEAVINDLCAMSTLFYEKCHHLLSRPYVLNPTFEGSKEVGGADADLIVDGCLFEIKAAKKQSVEPFWLRQIAGYVLLDYSNAYNISSVGIYMARQGQLLQWRIVDFLYLLTGDDTVSLAQLRQEFRTLCQGVQQGRRA